MHYMVIEDFRGGDPAPTYARLREGGRFIPDGLRYVSSWITDDMTRCYQVMETDDPALLEQWMAAWDDLTDFTVVPVISSAEAQARTG
jgi:hypothetical protein